MHWRSREAKQSTAAMAVSAQAQATWTHHGAVREVRAPAAASDAGEAGMAVQGFPISRTCLPQCVSACMEVFGSIGPGAHARASQRFAFVTAWECPCCLVQCMLPRWCWHRTSTAQLLCCGSASAKFGMSSILVTPDSISKSGLVRCKSRVEQIAQDLEIS